MSERDEHNGANRAPELEGQIQAYLDGILSGSELVAFENALIASPELMRSVNVYKQISSTLFATGDTFKTKTPSINVLAQVMAQVQQGNTADAENVVPFHHSDAIEAEVEAVLESIGQDFRATVSVIDVKADILEKVRKLEAAVESPKKDNIIPLRARPQHAEPKQQSGKSYPMYALLAIAAVLLLVIGALNTNLLMPNGNSTPQLANELPNPEDGEMNPGGIKTLGSGFTLPSVPRPLFALHTNPDGTESEANSGTSIYGSITLDTVLDNKRNATMSTDEGIKSLSLLKTWASLTPEQARRLLESGELSMDAILGAAQFLPPDEAAALLEQQAAVDPNNPYLNYSLAAIYAGLGNTGDALAQLAALERNDPGNALNPFLQASIRRAEGNDSLALALLLESAESENANTYALESANYRADALVAQGYDPVVADYLSSLSAGTNEYSQILNAANEFVAYGEEFEAMEDYAAAMSIYESLNRFGFNVSQNADFSNEQLAGLDTQFAAIQAIQDIVTIFQDPVGAQVLEESYAIFNQGLEGLGSFFNIFNLAMEAATSTEIASYTDEIMRLGDLGFVANLPQH